VWLCAFATLGIWMHSFFGGLMKSRFEGKLHTASTQECNEENENYKAANAKGAIHFYNLDGHFLKLFINKIHPCGQD
jgi:hypothetical protein